MIDDWDLKGLDKNNIQKNNSCCGDDLNKSVHDNSKVKNPTNPKNKVNKEFINDLEDFAFSLNIVNIGYVNNIKNYFLNNLEFNYKSAIVISIEMDQIILDTGAGEIAQKHNDNLYKRFGNYTYEISDYLRKHGYETTVAHPREDIIDLSKLGEKVGLGAIGKSGLLISPEFGSKQKIAAILVNINNLPSEKINEHLWIKKYCESCNKCINTCPHNALIEFKQNKLVKLNQDKCIGCSQGCTICIQTCPFYKKDYEKIKTIYNKLEKNKSERDNENN